MKVSLHLNMKLNFHRMTPRWPSKQERIDGLLGHVFRHRKWLQLVTNDDHVDVLIIGNALHRLYRRSTAAPGDYLMLILSDALGKPGRDWHEDAFFQSLQPHTFILDANEVVFASGVVLNVREVLEEPVPASIASTQICTAGVFGGLRTWCWSCARSSCRRARMRMSESCIVLYRR